MLKDTGVESGGGRIAMPETDRRTVDQKLIDADFFSNQDAVYELFTQMRRDDPVHWTVRDDGVGFWSIFKHAECRAVLDDAVLFNTGTTGQMPPFAAELDIVSKKGFGVGESILTTDPPRHTKMRAVFEGPFKPKKKPCWITPSVAPKSSGASSTTCRLRGECDLVADIGARIPMAVISDILKVPEEDWVRILSWGKMSHQGFNHDAETSLQGFNNMTQYCLGLSNERRGCPMGRSTRPARQRRGRWEAPVGRGDWPERDADAPSRVLKPPGMRLPGGVQTLLEHPAQMQYLREHPKGMRRAVEEVVRWTNAAVAFRRMATADTELGGKQTKKGDNIVVWFPSANRDEDVFENADVFDITRHPNPAYRLRCRRALLCRRSARQARTRDKRYRKCSIVYDGIEVIGPVE